MIAVDYRGYGLSTGRPTEQGIYRDVDALVARAWPDADPGVPLVYWGRSLGGAMAAYAATVRKPDGVILEAGFPDARSVTRGSPALAVLSLFSSYRFPAADFINAANVPVLQLHGDHDSVIPFELGRELSGRIHGPEGVRRDCRRRPQRHRPAGPSGLLVRDRSLRQHDSTNP